MPDVPLSTVLALVRVHDLTIGTRLLERFTLPDLTRLELSVRLCLERYLVCCNAPWARVQATPPALAVAWNIDVINC